MSHVPRHREVGHRQARILGERDELLDDVEAALVGEVGKHAGTAQVVPLALADPLTLMPVRPRCRLPRAMSVGYRVMLNGFWTGISGGLSLPLFGGGRQ